MSLQKFQTDKRGYELIEQLNEESHLDYEPKLTENFNAIIGPSLLINTAIQQEWLVDYGGLRVTLRITLWIIYLILFTSVMFAQSSADLFIKNLASVWYVPFITLGFYFYGLYQVWRSYPVCFNSKTGLVSFSFRGSLLQQQWAKLEAVLKAGVMRNNRSFLAINFYLLEKNNKRMEVRMLGSSLSDGKLEFHDLDWNKPGRHLWAGLCGFMNGKKIVTQKPPTKKQNSSLIYRIAYGIFIFPEAVINGIVFRCLKERGFPPKLEAAIKATG